MNVGVIRAVDRVGKLLWNDGGADVGAKAVGCSKSFKFRTMRSVSLSV
jgi:hypothetical protein